MILYPEYKGDPELWETPKLPALSEKFIKELEGIGQIAGYPRFRIVDATKATFYHEGDPDLPAGHYLAYMAMGNVQKLDGFMYADGAGWKTIQRADQVPAGKIALPNFTYKDFGIPRYMIEVYRDEREPGIAETGYRWAWTVDYKQPVVIEGIGAEISQYRHPSDFDLEHARILLGIIEKATEQSVKNARENFSQGRKDRLAEKKQKRQKEQDQRTEKIIRDL